MVKLRFIKKKSKNVFRCPHCKISIEILELNCGIFRCGIYEYKAGIYKQLPAHGKKSTIDKIKKKYKVYGCGNPIQYKGGLFIKTDWES